MYKSEISEFRISDLKAQKINILWTEKHVSAIREHPVPYELYTRRIEVLVNMKNKYFKINLDKIRLIPFSKCLSFNQLEIFLLTVKRIKTHQN